MKVEWLKSAVDDLKEIPTIHAAKLIPTALMLLQDPECGVVSGPFKDQDANKVLKIKPIRGYWVTFLRNDNVIEVTAVVECIRETNRGSRNTTSRIAQIQEETKAEFERLELLLSEGTGG